MSLKHARGFLERIKDDKEFRKAYEALNSSKISSIKDWATENGFRFTEAEFSRAKRALLAEGGDTPIGSVFLAMGKCDCGGWKGKCGCDGSCSCSGTGGCGASL